MLLGSDLVKGTRKVLRAQVLQKVELIHSLPLLMINIIFTQGRMMVTCSLRIQLLSVM